MHTTANDRIFSQNDSSRIFKHKRKNIKRATCSISLIENCVRLLNLFLYKFFFVRFWKKCVYIKINLSNAQWIKRRIWKLVEPNIQTRLCVAFNHHIAHIQQLVIWINADDKYIPYLFRNSSSQLIHFSWLTVFFLFYLSFYVCYCCWEWDTPFRIKENTGETKIYTTTAKTFVCI